MKAGAVGTPTRAKQIQNHVKGLAAGKGGVFHTAVAQLAKMKLTPIEQLHVASKVHEHTLNQMFPKQKPIRYLPKHGGGGTGLGGLEHAASVAYHASMFPAIADSFSHPGEFVGKDQARVEANNRRQAKAFSSAAETTTGYKEIEHIRQHPIAGTIALAGVLPFGKFGRLAELGVDAARGANTAEHAAEVARAAEDAKGLRKVALQRRAVRLGRRTSPEDAQAILEQERQNATARATKAARKNPTFLEHLPGETRPETGGAVGLKVREAMAGKKGTTSKSIEYPEGTLFHGSPEGQLGSVDALYHTKMWREGPGFYLTSDSAKAAKYAAGKTASADRKIGEGAVNAFRLKAGTKVLNLDTQPESFWRDLASKIFEEPVSEKTWKEWAKDIPSGKSSEGVTNRVRLLHLLTGWGDMPKSDAYYVIEEALHNEGVQATLHHENGVPVWVVKDESAIEKVQGREVTTSTGFPSVKKVYKKQQELQVVERAKRTGRLAATQKGAKSFDELAAAQKALAGEMPRAPFENFASLKPVLEDIKAHVDSLNMLPHDKSRLVNAIKAGVNGKVPAPAERKLIESVFGREVKQLSPEALKEHGIGNTVTDVLNIPRAILSSADLSGALRQGLGSFAYDPFALFKGYHQTLHAAISQKEFERIMAEEVHGSPYYHMAKADGVPITEIGQGLNQKEEAISSNLAEHLHEIPGVRSTPGVKQLAHGVSSVVKASDRNYVVLLNRTRMRLYTQMVEQAAANGYRMDGPVGEKLRKEIGDTVATLTGRGNLGKTLTAHRATFNALFFSPGLMKSRINLLNPVWYLHASPFARQERMKAGLRLYGLLSGVLVLAKMAGARVSTDPTNADFGKIRIGNTRIDPAGGLTQYIRLVGQLYEGKITSSVTGKIEPLSNGPFKTSRGNVAQQFLRNKLAPVPGFAYDAAFGPGLGQKMTPKSVAGNMLVPLLAQDMWQITHAKGPGGGPGMAAETFLPDLFGVGIQNYGAPKKKATSGSSDPFGSSGGSGNSDYFGGSGGSSGSPYFP